MEGHPRVDPSRRPAAQRVLIVDDEPVTRMVHSRQIARMGFVPIAVATAREALDELRVRSYDLIIVDAHLTDMHGAELARAVRCGPQPAIPIIAVSSDDSAENIQRLRDGGVSEFAVKPVTPEKLRELVERWLMRPAHPDHFPTSREPLTANLLLVLTAVLLGTLGLFLVVFSGGPNAAMAQIAGLIMIAVAATVAVITYLRSGG